MQLRQNATFPCSTADLYIETLGKHAPPIHVGDVLLFNILISFYTIAFYFYFLCKLTNANLKDMR